MNASTVESLEVSRNVLRFSATSWTPKVLRILKWRQYISYFPKGRDTTSFFMPKRCIKSYVPVAVSRFPKCIARQELGYLLIHQELAHSVLNDLLKNMRPV